MAAEPPPDDAPLSDAELEGFEAQLRALHAELRGQLADSEHGSKPVELDQQAVGRLSRLDAMQQQQMIAATRRLATMRLGLVAGALGRIADGAYGDCHRCEEPISRKRLRARPESAACLACQEALERDQ
jgi:DnaK suppressor protein